MRLTINLATRPYVELDRIFRQLRIAIAVLAVLAVGMMVWLHARSAQAREQQRELQAIQARTATLQAERAQQRGKAAAERECRGAAAGGLFECSVSAEEF